MTTITYTHVHVGTEKKWKEKYGIIKIIAIKSEPKNNRKKKNENNKFPVIYLYMLLNTIFVQFHRCTRWLFLLLLFLLPLIPFVILFICFSLLCCAPRPLTNEFHLTSSVRCAFFCSFIFSFLLFFSIILTGKRAMYKLRHSSAINTKMENFLRLNQMDFFSSSQLLFSIVYIFLPEKRRKKRELIDKLFFSSFLCCSKFR